MSNTEILAERGGLRLVLTMKDIYTNQFYIKLGDYMVVNTGGSKLGYTHFSIIPIDRSCVMQTLKSKETASKMAIEWFNSLFENVQ